MDIRKTRTCERCRAVVPLEKVRLVPNPKGEQNLLVCEPCSVEVIKKPVTPSKMKKLPSPEETKYFCGRCRYSFRADASKIGVTYNLHCPYCGKTDQLHEKP